MQRTGKALLAVVGNIFGNIVPVPIVINNAFVEADFSFGTEIRIEKPDKDKEETVNVEVKSRLLSLVISWPVRPAIAPDNLQLQTLRSYLELTMVSSDRFKHSLQAITDINDTPASDVKLPTFSFLGGVDYYNQNAVWSFVNDNGIMLAGRLVGYGYKVDKTGIATINVSFSETLQKTDQPQEKKETVEKTEPPLSFKNFINGVQ